MFSFRIVIQVQLSISSTSKQRLLKKKRNQIIANKFFELTQLNEKWIFNHNEDKINKHVEKNSNR